MRPLLLLALAAPLAAQPLYRASQVAVVAASGLDVASSWGRHELNPLLGVGSFGGRQMGIKAASVGCSMVAADRLTVGRRRKWVTVANFALAGGLSFVAARNWRTR